MVCVAVVLLGHDRAVYGRPPSRELYASAIVWLPGRLLEYAQHAWVVWIRCHAVQESVQLTSCEVEDVWIHHVVLAREHEVSHDVMVVVIAS